MPFLFLVFTLAVLYTGHYGYALAAVIVAGVLAMAARSAK